MSRRTLGGATIKSVSGDVPILQQLKALDEYEQASAPDIQLIDKDGNVAPRDGTTEGALQIRGPWIIKRYFKAETDRWAKVITTAGIKAD